MATPIRWDTVRGPSLAEAAAPLQQAQRSFLTGFGDLGNVLAQREAMDQANFQNTRNNNANAFLDAVAKYKTPEELKAAQDSGALDALRASFGGNVDAGAIRGAADARMAALQQQAQNRIAYEHMQTDERVAPLLDQFKQASLKGDKAGMAAAQAQYAQLGGRDLAGLASFADQRAQQMVERGRAGAKFDDELLTSKARRQHMANADANAAAQLGISREQLGLQRDQMNLVKEDRLSAQVQKALEAMGNSTKLSSGSPEGQAKIADYIDKIKDPDIQSNARKAAAQLIGTKDMTVAGVIAGISGIDKRDWFTNGDILYSNSNNVDDAVARGKKFLTSADAQEYELRRALGYSAAQKSYQSAEQRLQDFRNSLLNASPVSGPSPGTTPGGPGFMPFPSKAKLQQTGRMKGNRIDDDR